MNFLRRTLIFLSILGCIACGVLWYLPNVLKAKKVEIKKYTLTAFNRDKKKITEIKKIAEEKGYETKVKKVKKFKKKKIGVRVALHLNEKGVLIGLRDNLKKKKYPVRFVHDKDENDMYLTTPNIKSEKKAQKLRDKLDELTYSNFIVEDNYKKFPYWTHRIIILNVEGEEAVETLKSEIGELSQEEIVVKNMEEYVPEEMPDEKSVKGKKDNKKDGKKKSPPKNKGKKPAKKKK